MKVNLYTTISRNKTVFIRVNQHFTPGIRVMFCRLNAGDEHTSPVRRKLSSAVRLIGDKEYPCRSGLQYGVVHLPSERVEPVDPHRQRVGGHRRKADEAGNGNRLTGVVVICSRVGELRSRVSDDERTRLVHLDPGYPEVCGRYWPATTSAPLGENGDKAGCKTEKQKRQFAHE